MTLSQLDLLPNNVSQNINVLPVFDSIATYVSVDFVVKPNDIVASKCLINLVINKTKFSHEFLIFIYFFRLFGNTGMCAACNKVIPAFEMVMRARNNVYHLECFACQQCNHR